MNNIYTIGHSVVGLQPFIFILKEFHIDVLVDVRTKPYSTRVGWFNREVLECALNSHDIKYLYRGKNLGGLGKNVDYVKTIEALSQLSKRKTIVLMCSEADYRKCHRFLTLTPEFESKNIIVEHIDWDNKIKAIQQKLFQK